MYSINLATGVSTLAFTTRIGNLMGIATDSNGDLIATSYSSPSQFERINTITGTSVIVGNIGGGINYDHGGDIQLAAATPTASMTLLGIGAFGMAGYGAQAETRGGLTHAVP